MKAAVALPAPDGLTEELVGQAVYELGKLGTIETNPIFGEHNLEVFALPEEMNPAGAPEGLVFLRFVASLIPYVEPEPKSHYERWGL